MDTQIKSNKLKILLVVLAVVIVLGVLYFAKINKSNEIENINTEKVAEEPKVIEEDKAPRIDENSTEAEIYGNDYMKHIRASLDAYVAGTNAGIEKSAIEKSTVDGQNCGLVSFDTSYFKSKFIIVNASNHENGGTQARLFFVDKPDTLFWAWVYKYPDNGYMLKSFCKEMAIPNKTATDKSTIQKIIKESAFTL